MAENTTAVALPPQPIPLDLVKEMAMDIGKEVAAHLERMYPNSVKDGCCLLSVRNCCYNEIMAALAETDPDLIRARLSERKMARRKLRALWKAARTVTPDTPRDEVDLVLSGALTAPDIGDERPTSLPSQ